MCLIGLKVVILPSWIYKSERPKLSIKDKLKPYCWKSEEIYNDEF